MNSHSRQADRSRPNRNLSAGKEERPWGTECEPNPSSSGSSRARETGASPHGAELQDPDAWIMSVLEGVATRDDQIQEGLLKLQRSLSRQSFRGAESARRLVRRLGRKLQQNQEAVSLLYTRTWSTQTASYTHSTPHPLLEPPAPSRSRGAPDSSK